MRTLVAKKCEWCGISFTQEKKRKSRFCGRRCARFWQNRDQRGSCASRLERKCERCGAGVSSRYAGARFCSYECGLLGRRRAVFSEETRKKRSEQMRSLNERLDVKAKLIAFRASDRCPIKLPENRQKRIENQRALGFPNLNYGGGPTVPQKILFNALPGATMEFVLLGTAKSNSLRIDIAIPSLKLAIEVDGLSHTKRKQKACDARKEQALKERGWALLRFWNAEILGDLPSVLMRIHAMAAMLQKPERMISHGSVA
jgi:hypothetical protein